MKRNDTISCPSTTFGSIPSIFGIIYRVLIARKEASNGTRTEAVKNGGSQRERSSVEGFRRCFSGYVEGTSKRHRSRAISSSGASTVKVDAHRGF